MDTFSEIIVVTNDRDKSQEIIDKAFGRINEIEKIADFYSPDSELSLLNHIRIRKVNPQLYKLLMAAKRYGQITDGGFDITVGHLMTLWGFGRGKEINIPPMNKLKQAVSDAGYFKIKFKNGWVILPDNTMKIDLGGIAKGYAVDEASQLFKTAGVTNTLIDIGGNIYASGKNRYGRPWQIGIRHPRNNDELIGILELSDKAVSTSGDYERFRIINSKRYHHILNPKTGLPADRCISVTVITKTAMVADILSTAVFVLGWEDGLRLIENTPDTEALVVTSNKLVKLSSGMKVYLKSRNSSDPP